MRRCCCCWCCCWFVGWLLACRFRAVDPRLGLHICSWTFQSAVVTRAEDQFSHLKASSTKLQQWFKSPTGRTAVMKARSQLNLLLTGRAADPLPFRNPPRAAVAGASAGKPAGQDRLTARKPPQPTHAAPKLVARPGAPSNGFSTQIKPITGYFKAPQPQPHPTGNRSPKRKRDEAEQPST